MGLGKKLEQAMKARGYKQASLSRALDCDPAKLNAVLRRNSRKSELLEPAARVLQIPVEWFLSDDDSPVPPTPSDIQPEQQAAAIPPSIEEQEMETEVGARLLVKAWKALPENERDEALEQLQTKALRYRSPKRDHQLTHLAATKEGEEARKKQKAKAGTQ